eukprot:gene2822-3618_t
MRLKARVGWGPFRAVTTVVCSADILCTFTNPVDDNVAYKELVTAKGETYDDKRDSKVVGEQFYCVLCQASVGKRSKHCRACDKCVCGFDHHCKWLNNCVGSKNYQSFFILITFTLTMIGIQFAVVLGLFICCFTDSDFMEVRNPDRSHAIAEATLPDASRTSSGRNLLPPLNPTTDKPPRPPVPSSSGYHTPGFQGCCQNRKVGDVGMQPKRKKVSRNMLRLCYMENPNDKSSAQGSGAEPEPSAGWSAVGAMDDHSKGNIHTITMEKDSGQPSQASIEHENSTPTIGMTPVAKTSQAALLLVIIALIGELFCFHIILNWKGMTTYDYILAERDRKEAPPAPKPQSAEDKGDKGGESSNPGAGAKPPERRPSIELQLSRQSSPANSMGTSAFATPLGTPSGVKVSCSATSVVPNGNDKDETSSEEGDLSPPTREGATLVASPGRVEGKVLGENTAV